MILFDTFKPLSDTIVKSHVCERIGDAQAAGKERGDMPPSSPSKRTSTTGHCVCRQGSSVSGDLPLPSMEVNETVLRDGVLGFKKGAEQDFVHLADLLGRLTAPLSCDMLHSRRESSWKLAVSDARNTSVL